MYLSLSQGNMDCLTNAVLLPLIKELDNLIDADVLKDYRPVSNLVYLSKPIEPHRSVKATHDFLREFSIFI